MTNISPEGEALVNFRARAEENEACAQVVKNSEALSKLSSRIRLQLIAEIRARLK